MENHQETGHSRQGDVVLAVVSLSSMVFGWISLKSAHEILQVVATVVSIGAGAMVFWNNYKSSKNKK